ncbi:hypothetical protein SPHS6_01821 [Sphingobium sp. S6]|nr:hypothetical protein SPHS6_01821 [Sphingobium sp. S6]
MKVRRFVSDPAKEAGDPRMRAQNGAVTLRAGQLDIAQLRMDCAMTNRCTGTVSRPPRLFGTG